MVPPTVRTAGRGADENTALIPAQRNAGHPIPEMFTIKPFVLGGLGGIWAAFAPFLKTKTVYSRMVSKYLSEPNFVPLNGLIFSKIGSIFSCSQSQECVQWNEFFRKDGQDVACFQSQTFENWNGQQHFRNKLAVFLPVSNSKILYWAQLFWEKWSAFSPPGLNCFATFSCSQSQKCAQSNGLNFSRKWAASSPVYNPPNLCIRMNAKQF